MQNMFLESRKDSGWLRTIFEKSLMVGETHLVLAMSFCESFGTLASEKKVLQKVEKKFMNTFQIHIYLCS